MPILSVDEFKPNFLLRRGHINTILSDVLSVHKVNFVRERISTPDGDFIDLDQLKNNNSKALLLCHGLEGSSQSSYIRLFSHYFSARGWDIVAMNYRGCSGQDNLKVESYNSGTTGDLDLVIHKTLAVYQEIAIIGFSLGGNILLKYLGDGAYSIPTQLTKSVAISAPVHLSDASQTLLKKENYVYQRRFLLSLMAKMNRKKTQFPDDPRLQFSWKIRDLYAFDKYFTAPMFGYESAEHYYASNQSIQWLDKIEHPCLIINAEDDPFLGLKCYPYDICGDSEFLSLCAPKYGGHVGFSKSFLDRSWICDISHQFITEKQVS